MSPPRPQLLERESETARLTGLLAALGDGRGGALLLEGPPGIGKTALLDTLLASADPKRFTILRARGSELEGGLTFGGVRQLFAAATLGLGDEDRAAVLHGPAAFAAPVLGLEAPRALPAGEHVDAAYGLYWLAMNLAERSPLILAIDDLHWLDTESLRYVGYLLGRLDDSVPVLLVATARAPEPGVDTIATAVQAAFADVLRPGPLSPQASAQLVEGQEEAQVYRLTGGNPLLCLELQRSTAAAPLGTPLEELGSATVARLVLDRVRKVSLQATALAEVVALFGDGVELEDAAHVAELDPDVAGTAADALIEAQVFAADERLRFLHPLMRAAVYDELGMFARRRGHTRAARRLREQGAPGDEIAAHLLASPPGGDPAVVEILRAAAAGALASYAPRAAARYLQRALAEPPESAAERSEIGLELGRCQALVGDPAAEATLRQALADSADARRSARIAIELSSAAFSNMHYDEALADLDVVSALEVPREDRLALDAMRAIVADEARDRSRLYEAAIRRMPADLRGDTPSERLALHALAMDRLNRVSPVAEALELFRRLAEDDGRPDTAGVGVIDLIDGLIACGDLDLAQELALERAQRARETGAEAHYADAQVQLSAVVMMRGEFRSAEAFARLAFEAPGATPGANAWAVSALVQVLALQGRLDEAEAVLRANAPTASPGSQTDVYFSGMWAMIAALRGEHAAAVPGLERRHMGTIALGLRNPTQWMLLQYLAPALAGVGRASEAEAMLREWLGHAVRFGALLPLGTAHTELYRRLRPAAAAREHLEEAVRIFDGSAYRWNEAWVRAELGAELRRENKAREGRALLEAALDYAEREDVRPLVAFAEGELRLTGARPRRRLLSGVDALTPAELRIAHLAAGGRTNREIAQHLFLTVKTVETHLARSYRKLEIGSRRELAAVLGGESE